MIRKVYFAFHYEKDLDLVCQVRDAVLARNKIEIAGFYNQPLWAKTKKAGEVALMQMLLEGMQGTTVTVFLMGEETAGRKWVQYELEESWKRGNAMIGLHIHNVRNSVTFKKSKKGPNLLDDFIYEVKGKECALSEWFKTYDWETDDGENNFGKWVDEAVKIEQGLRQDDDVDK